jgi:anti-sigma regulatory factor (Ser/Thr protein kinase)
MTATDPKVRTATYLARFECLTELREFAKRAAKAAGLSVKAVYAVQMAVDEAFTNIIEHAYGGESNEKVDCKCTIGDDRLTIWMRDCGAVFNPEEIKDPDLNAPLEERTVGGLGLFFIRQLMDEVQFTFIQGEEGRDCNILKMVKLKESRK